MKRVRVNNLKKYLLSSKLIERRNARKRTTTKRKIKKGSKVLYSKSSSRPLQKIFANGKD
jgi:hypothetical protein